MAEMTDAQFKQKVIDVLDEVGANIGSAGDIDTITSVEEWNRLANSITLPGIEMEQSEVKRYVAAPLSYFAAYAESASAAIQTAWQAWFGITDDDGVRHSWLEFFEGAQAEWTGPSGLKTDVVAATNAATAATKEWYDSEHPNDGYKKQVTDALATAADDHQQAAGYADAERTREEQESARQAAETQRNNAETTRQSQEDTRAEAEATRQLQETTRQSQEATRAEAETARAGAETARVQAEQVRVDEFASSKTAAETATADAERVDATLAGTTLTVTDRNGRSNSVDTAEAAKAAKADWDTNYKTQIETAQAGAENVNAQLSGMTVTITNRQGQSTSVDIGFDIYRTYSSVAQMNADAANVPQGKFVMIATSSATDPENARLYGKNNFGSFTFLSDLDQASSAAWADWLNNQKPLIEQATEDANDAADLAETKAGLADTAATNANSIYTTVDGWFNGQDGFKNTSEGWLSSTQTTWANWFSDSLATGVRKLWNDFWPACKNAWEGWFGTSAEDSNGVRKIWSTWYGNTQSAWNTWFSTTDSNGVRKLWNDFWPAAKNTWEGWFGTDDTEGVQAEWAALTQQAASDHSTASADHSQAGNDHSTATSDHTTAELDHSTAETDHTAAESATSAANIAASAATTAAGNASDAATSANNAATAAGTATTAANNAASAATTATTNAEGAATAATSAASAATTAAGNAIAAANSASSAATSATNAASSATSAASSATSAASTANTAAGNADTATESATSAASSATSAASTANTAADTANAAALAANGAATSATNAATAANNAASTATTAAGNANTAASTATTQANRAKEWADHPPFIGNGTTGDENYWYLWDEANDQYVKGAYAKGDALDYDSMTPEEKKDLVDDIKANLVFATVEEGQAAAAELN